MVGEDLEAFLEDKRSNSESMDLCHPSELAANPTMLNNVQRQILCEFLDTYFFSAIRLFLHNTEHSDLGTKNNLVYSALKAHPKEFKILLNKVFPPPTTVQDSAASRSNNYFRTQFIALNAYCVPSLDYEGFGKRLYQDVFNPSISPREHQDLRISAKKQLVADFMKENTNNFIDAFILTLNPHQMPHEQPRVASPLEEPREVACGVPLHNEQVWSRGLGRGRSY